MPTTQAVRADIATLNVEAIVRVAHNASQDNRSLGNAKIIEVPDMSARFVIETVVPLWQGGSEDEQARLASCYTRCIEIAETSGARSIAFPEIADCAAGFPVEMAAAIAVASVSAAVEGTPVIGEVIFCCQSRQALQHYRAALMQPG